MARWISEKSCVRVNRDGGVRWYSSITRNKERGDQFLSKSGSKERYLARDRLVPYKRSFYSPLLRTGSERLNRVFARQDIVKRSLNICRLPLAKLPLDSSVPW